MLGTWRNLASLVSKCHNASLCSTIVRPLSSAPCVYDYLIRFHVIDTKGKRHTLKGLEGKSVATAMFESGLFKGFDDFCYGPDQPNPDTHVYISNDFLSRVGPLSEQEKVAIDLCGSEVRPKCAPLRLVMPHIELGEMRHRTCQPHASKAWHHRSQVPREPQISNR
jgi:hypothetical protein